MKEQVQVTQEQWAVPNPESCSSHSVTKQSQIKFPWQHPLTACPQTLDQNTDDASTTEISLPVHSILPGPCICTEIQAQKNISQWPTALFSQHRDKSNFQKESKEPGHWTNHWLQALWKAGTCFPLRKLERLFGAENVQLAAEAYIPSRDCGRKQLKSQEPSASHFLPKLSSSNLHKA